MKPEHDDHHPIPRLSTPSTQSTSSTSSTVVRTGSLPIQPTTTAQFRLRTSAVLPIPHSAFRIQHFFLLLLLPGCLSRGYPPDFIVENLTVTEDSLTCHPILYGSPGQVKAFYRTKVTAGTAAVTIYVKTRRHGNMGDDFRTIRVPLTPAVERVVLTNGTIEKEIWHR